MNQRPIIFGPGDKLRWQEEIAFDPDGTAFEARLAIAISNRIDKHTGAATIDQEWLAAKIGGSARGVRQAAERLAARGHMTIEHSRGRGLSNVYRPSKRGTPVPLFETEKRNGEALKPERRDTKTGTPVPPLPKDYLNSSYPTSSSGDPNTRRWLSVKKGMAEHLGLEVVAAWFSLVTVEAITPAEVVLCTKAFARKYIEEHYAQRLLIEWQREVPTVERVTWALPIARAAE